MEGWISPDGLLAVGVCLALGATVLLYLGILAGLHAGGRRIRGLLLAAAYRRATAKPDSPRARRLERIERLLGGRRDVTS